MSDVVRNGISLARAAVCCSQAAAAVSWPGLRQFQGKQLMQAECGLGSTRAISTGVADADALVQEMARSANEPPCWLCRTMPLPRPPPPELILATHSRRNLPSAASASSRHRIRPRHRPAGPGCCG